jgi:hypothetical protein
VLHIYHGFGLTNVEAEVDGVILGDLNDYIVTSPPFNFGPLPDLNVLQYFGVDAPAGATSPSVSDGYWLMLAPLQKGSHTIRFTGTMGTPINFTLDITYNLLIMPPQADFTE